MALRNSTATWNGNLIEGSGSFTVDSGAFDQQAITWKARTEDSDGATSPEELLAAAHASCYAMAFSHALATAGTPAEQLTVTSTVGFGPKPGGGMMVTHSHLKVVGKVPGMDAAAFAKAAVDAEGGCPVSNALRNNIEITVDATLA